MAVRRWTASSVITVIRRSKKMREEHDQIIDASRPLTRRGFAMWGAAGLLTAGVGSLTLAQVSAREAEPGDDRGGNGTDDDRRHRRRRRRNHG
jgi:hypothetical protein